MSCGIESLFTEELRGVMVAVCTKAMRKGTMSFSFKKRKADLSHLKIKNSSLAKDSDVQF